MSATRYDWFWWKRIPTKPIDWALVGRVTLNTASLLADYLEQEAERQLRAEREAQTPIEVRDAAQLLGVPVEATADQVRAALRANMSGSQIHPDQGGDAETAKRFIAAKNLLVERVKVRP